MTQEVTTIEGIDPETGEVITLENTGDNVSEKIDRLRAGNVAIYSSVTGNDRASRMTVAKAVTDSVPLSENLNTEIELAHFVVQAVDVKDVQANATINAPRVILIDSKGKAYHSISTGILEAVNNICGLFGKPGDLDGMWPLKVKAVEERTRSGFKVITLKVIG